MNSLLRRVLLAATVLMGAYVGIFGYAFPHAFYTSFPGLGLHWIDVDGPYNQHLTRDVGSLYIALAAGSVGAIFTRTASAGRVMGIAWFVFGVLHFGYHVTHPEGTTGDIVGSIISLVLSALLGLALMLPLQPYRAAHVDADSEVRP
jgi:hypothetical protein